MKPNLFEYATSELSQDAFFCWLLKWSEKEFAGEPLNKISLRFINYLLRKTGKPEIASVDKIEIVRQEKNIDFYCVINNMYVIAFEDKISTRMHDEQLAKYKEHITEKYSDKSLSFVYLKTDILFSWERWRAADCEGYVVVDMDNLLNVLNQPCESDIFSQFVACLQSRKEKYERYATKALNEWERSDWLGFMHRVNFAFKGSNFGEHYKGEVDWWLRLTEKWDCEYDYSLSLELNPNGCAVKAHFDEGYGLDNIRDVLKQIIGTDMPKMLPDDCQFSPTGGSLGKGKNVTVGYVENYIVQNDCGFVNVDETLNRIKTIVDAFNAFGSQEESN